MTSDGDLDSHGQFTVDSVRALESLAQYQLAGPEWIPLKIVQAAVAAGALCVVCHLRRDDVVLSFPFPSEVGLENFSLTEFGDNAWERDLRIGLRAAAKVGSWMLQVQGKDGGFRTHCDGEDYSRCELPPRRPLEFHFELLKLLPKKYASALRADAHGHEYLAIFRLQRRVGWWRFITRGGNEQALMCERTPRAPIPVFVDGVMLNQEYSLGEFVAQEYRLAERGGPNLLAPAAEPRFSAYFSAPWGVHKTGNEFPAVLLVHWEGVEQNKGDRPMAEQILIGASFFAGTPSGSSFPTTPCLDGNLRLPARRCLYWITIPRNGVGAAVFTPTRYGVSLDPIEFEGLPAGTRVIWACEHLKDDLAGKKIVMDAEFQAVRVLCHERVERLLAQAQLLDSED